MTSENASLAVSRSLTEVFLETIEEGRGELAPLTPFMRHVARQAGITDAALAEPEGRANFVSWFFDTHHRLRAPYRWSVPPKLLEWLNTPAVPGPVDAPPGRKPYLTRFMESIRLRHKQEFNTRLWEGFLRFLGWFAFECIPQWNLPPTLLPDELAALLNEPGPDGRLPLTRGMAIWMEQTRAGRYGTARAGHDAALLAMSFEAVTAVLGAGDPRLLPEFVTRYWTARVEKGAELTRYQYLAARAFCPELDPVREPEAARRWFHGQYVNQFPHTDALGASVNVAGQPLDDGTLRPPPTTFFVYRDHHTICGLSRAGKTSADVLRQAALPVIDIDFALSRNAIREEYAYNARQFCQTSRGFHLLNLNPEYVPECLMSHLTKVAESDYLIGQFYWELSDIGACHECALSLVDEVWAASEYLKDVYSRRINKPVIVMGQAVEAAAAPGRLTRHSLGLLEDSYVFLFSFDAASVLERKNPLALVRAFRKAFPSGSENTRLVIKTMNAANQQTDRDRKHWRAVLNQAAEDPRVKILDTRFNDGEMADLFEICDCYVSLHRSEGFGFGPAEALAREKPVITTGYSGVRDFCTPETALLVDYQLVPVQPGAYPYMDPGRRYEWADPSPESAAAQMRDVWQNPEKGIRLGRHGQELMARQYSVGALWSRYRARLIALGALEGE
jgi:glycosyltransferase involved in cell wall biosynthesis